MMRERMNAYAWQFKKTSCPSAFYCTILIVGIWVTSQICGIFRHRQKMQISYSITMEKGQNGELRFIFFDIEKNSLKYMEVPIYHGSQTVFHRMICHLFQIFSKYVFVPQVFKTMQVKHLRSGYQMSNNYKPYLTRLILNICSAKMNQIFEYDGGKIF